MSPTPSSLEVVSPVYEPSRTLISWASVIAGVLAAIAIYFTLAQLCLAGGLALYTPFDREGAEGGTVAIGMIIAGLIAMVASLFLGGWIAGRLTTCASWFIAGTHGLLVWATASVVTALLIAGVAGMMAGGAVKAMGAGIDTVATTAAQALPEVISATAPNWETIRGELQESMRQFASNPDKTTANLTQRSRLMELLGSSFSMDPNARMSDPDRKELTTLLSAQTGMASDEAARALDQWNRTWRAGVDRYEATKAEATERAKQLAMTAKRRTAQIAGAGFALMVVGAIAGFLGGAHGHVCRTRSSHEPRATTGTTPLGSGVPVVHT